MNDELTDVDISYVSDKPLIACLPRTIWPILSLFLVFCYYFTHLNDREINQQYMRNKEKVCHTVKPV